MTGPVGAQLRAKRSMTRSEMSMIGQRTFVFRRFTIGSGPYRALIGAAGLCAALLVLALTATSAFAERTFESQITGFNSAYGIAIDGSENVWIDDYGNSGNIYEYSSTNTFLGSRTSEGHYGGNIHSIAIDNSTGRLYVADSGPVYVDVFKSGLGEYLETWHTENSCGLDYVAVADGGTAKGTVYVARSCSGAQHIQALKGADEAANFSGTASYISENHITGTPTGEIGNISNIATDAEGNIYVVDQSNSVVDEFNSAGIFVQAFNGEGATHPFSGNLEGVAVDPTNGDVLVVDSGNNVVDEFESSGGFLGEIKGTGPSQETPFTNLPGGIAVNGSGNVYIANGGSVDIYSGNFIVPKISYGEVTEATHTSATLHAIVDPNEGGNVISCSFEYGTDTSYSLGTEPCLNASGEEVGTPGSPIETPTQVHANISSLTTETTYHYRVVAGNVNGARKGADQTFTPHAVAGLSTEAATQTGPTSATLNASFTGDGEDTHYYFEWGETTAYGNDTAVPPGLDAGSPTGPEPTTLSFGLTGLNPESTYYYRVVAKNGVGTSYGEAQPILTPPAVTGLGTEAATQIGPTSATLNASFTGDGEDTHYYFEWGETTAYGNDTAVPPGLDAGSPTGPEPTKVAFKLTGLDPVTNYHYRIVASNRFGTTYGNDQPFTTLPSAPLVRGSVSDVHSDTAVLHADINPGGGDTTYHFEYGTAPCSSNPCTSIPIPDAEIGSGTTFQSVSAHLDGLSAGTTYHWRVVAENVTGTTEGADETFTTFPYTPITNETCPNAHVRQQTGCCAAARLPRLRVGLGRQYRRL